MHITKILPPLPYDRHALAPVITEETLDYHYGKHHAAYVNNLMNIVSDSKFNNLSIEEMIKTGFETHNEGLFNNAAQHWNHTFFWNCLSPHGGKTPKNEIAALINRDFGSFESFKNNFTTISSKLFGCGWTWLALNNNKKLEILPLKNADNPLIFGKKPLIALDVWEHAYYIDYRNARPKFIDGFWEIVNWDFANQNLK
ncbi:superoxide dismutase [Apibacter raozihei]|uniref:superoxide dismutase n=1 Tax=Apibacter TaxID=1778601 RepID=UPI000FE31B08|nr:MULTISPECIES: superoxide dismutase [Apibacter]